MTYVLQNIDSPVSYDTGLKLQKRAFELVQSGHLTGVILMLEHLPVVTVGQRNRLNNLLVSEEKLKQLGIQLAKTNRGGDITFHGPGQLVVYPVLNLNCLKKDTHWYLRQLETVIINTLRVFDIQGTRKEKYTGVWVGNQKIAAIGVHVSKWITQHGLSLNLSVDKDFYKLINPCGITEYGVTSLSDCIGGFQIKDILGQIKIQFENVFGIRIIEGHMYDI